MSAKSVKVSNLSLKASLRDVSEFFSFSGDIVYVEVQSNDDCSQNAFVTFTDSQGADTAVLLSGATIVDMTVTVTLAPEYNLPPEAATALPPRGRNAYAPAKVKPESTLSNMFAKGVVLGKDAVTKAKSFDQKHGLTQKVNTGTSMVTEKVKDINQKLQISKNTMSAFAAAEQTVSKAGSAIMTNKYVITSVSWVTSVVNKVVKTSQSGQQTEEKTGKGENGNKQNVYSSESPKGLGQTEPKPALVQGLNQTVC
ncbi:binding partner of ACD11 1-like [Bidens hawaiensis]|uniref:binding partner of ACD11 1-like n=1 Tax=Bidens hawaiensis TaxID=980011 RepID=UPI00404B2C9D